MKSVKKLAIVFLGLAMLLIIAATTWYCLTKVDTSPSSLIIEHSSGNGTYIPEEETETETIETPRIALVDRSGSMDGLIPAIAGYDQIKEFGLDDTSPIATSIIAELKYYRNKIGVVSDLESYPEAEFDVTLNVPDEYYHDVELIFYVPADVNELWLKNYEYQFSRILSPYTSTLKFIQNGNVIYCPFDNFEEATIEKSENGSVYTEAADYLYVEATENKDTVPMIAFVILAALFGVVTLGLIIALICLCGNSDGESKTPAGIIRALSADAVALDGSGSVSSLYKDFISWCKKENTSSVYRFASDVQVLSISEAESKSAEGNTHGYEALKRMADDGCKVITIVSDFEFNDDASVAKSVYFDKIYMVGRNISKAEIDKMIPYSKEIEVVRI